jgi:hypothetical protein
MNGNVKLELSEDEAIVFFDWIKRFNNKDNQFEDQAEERVLWDIEALLEKKLLIPFDSEYSKLLLNARRRIRDQE